MKLVIQRVNKAQVTVENKIVASIAKGLVVFLAIEKSDDLAKIDYLVDKLVKLRIFAADDKKFDQSLETVNAEVLVISQFTLCANLAKGQRPDFFAAAKPLVAKKLYLEFIKKLKDKKIKKVAHGVFGAYMQVNLENDGPSTFILEK